MNYPNGKKKNETNVSFANRGMGLEEDINETNKYYLDRNIAVIYKRPTSITVKKVEYPNKNYTKITDGYFNTPSTTDYNGIYKGFYLDFEAKETSSKTSFPLANIHKHQLLHIEKIIEHGGIAFFIIRFSKLGKTFIIFGEDVLKISNTKKSIPIDLIEENGIIVKESFIPRLDYIKVIDTYIKERENEKIRKNI